MMLRNACFVFLGMVAIVGCGNGGPTTYPASGKVTFDGKPVPVGTIRFTPDAEAGNDWKSAVGEIKNGKYSIARNGGVIGGPYEIVVFGYDGVAFEDGEGTNSQGKPLFAPYTVKQELEKEAATIDIDVPAKDSGSDG